MRERTGRSRRVLALAPHRKSWVPSSSQAAQHTHMFVATITGLPRLRQPCTICDCQYGTCEAGRWTEEGGS